MSEKAYKTIIDKEIDTYNQRAAEISQPLILTISGDVADVLQIRANRADQPKISDLRFAGALRSSASVKFNRDDGTICFQIENTHYTRYKCYTRIAGELMRGMMENPSLKNPRLTKAYRWLRKVEIGHLTPDDLTINSMCSLQDFYNSIDSQPKEKRTELHKAAYTVLNAIMKKSQGEDT